MAFRFSHHNWIVVGLLLATAGLAGCRQSSSSPEVVAGGAAATTERGPVVVIFELPEGEVRREIADVASGTTVAEVLRQINDPQLTISGSGQTTFVSAIGDLGTTQGSGWTFSVNDVKADRGVGSLTLTPPATVRWQHTSFAKEATDASDRQDADSAAEAAAVSAE